MSEAGADHVRPEKHDHKSESVEKSSEKKVSVEAGAELKSGKPNEQQLQQKTNEQNKRVLTQKEAEVLAARGAKDQMNPVEHLARTLIEIGLAETAELQGCSDEQIIALEARRSLKLPESYKTFLKAIGNGAGSFENDALWTYSTLEDAQREAVDMLEKNNIQFPNTIFAFDTGDSSFLFFDPAAGDDPPVCLYESGDLSPRELADSFSSWLTMHANELKDMHDKSLKSREEMPKAGIKPGKIHGSH